MKRPGEAASDFVQQALHIERVFMDRVGVDALRPEAKLLLLLNQHGAMSVKQAMSISGLSYRGFYNLLNRLSSQRLVTITPDTHDRRVKKIAPGDRANFASLLPG